MAGASDYVVVTVPRTGSTMLCSLLAANGAGHPEEHLNPDVGASGFADAVRCGSATEAYLDGLRASAPGAFGTKLMVHWLPQLRAACAEATADDAVLLRRLFPDATYVRLRRRDTVGMAISHSLAMATGEWQGTRRDAPAGREISMEEVDQHLRWLLAGEERWTIVLGELGVVPYEVAYEDLLDAPGPTLTALLAHLGVAPIDLQVTPSTSVQRGRAAAELRRRYERWAGRTRPPAQVA